MITTRIPRPPEQLTPEERVKQTADFAWVPAWKLQALIDLLVAKSVITAKDLETDSARTP